MKVLIGEKLGMTRIFDQDGRAFGVTAVKVWPGTVVRVKTAATDGYEAVQVGAGAAKGRGKAFLGQTGGKAYRVLREFPKTSDDVAPGATLDLDQLETGQEVSVTAVSKGKGFQGTVKRHNFSRGPKSHGSRNYRRPGSIGGTGASRVFPGQKMPGRMGNARVTQKNLIVAGIEAEDAVVLLRGSVPGPPGGVVTLQAT